ncbi:transmembrane protein 39A-like [Xenia sp. Carnegie-2017]|uniref:transmembrane protein 39A-like n=1 Tax=Xenia sp. Carnegie-2017 TaxID=2897299 RepID=UPI001F04ECC0|nr:transmembrane protein 39A-like [Xenia sp. Carnegie-2017]
MLPVLMLKQAYNSQPCLYLCFHVILFHRYKRVYFMPAGRKIASSKNNRSNVKAHYDSREVYNLRNMPANSNVASPTSSSLTTRVSTLNKPLIYHRDHPMTPVFTALGFEFFYLVYGLIALLSQYVNIYQMNYHLINYQEVLVIALFLMRRVGWIVFKQIVLIKEMTSVWIVCSALLKGLILVLVMAAFMILMLQLYRTTSLVNILLFIYPTMTYLWVFGFTMELKLKKVLPKVIHQGCVPRNKVLSSDSGSSCQADNELRFNQRHCSVSPDVVRSEAEGHRLDFNFKIKRVLFQSFICAYYVGFIPMRFSKRFYVYYDVWWSCQHVVLVWIGSMILLMKYFVPLHYCYSLSKCAVHLGAWAEHEEEDETLSNHRDWSALTSWPQDVVVNYKNRRLYKSLGIQNVADPGDVHHWRFYFVFQTPTRLINWLLFVLCIVIFYQLVMLYRFPLWHEVVSLCLLLLLNYIVLFKLLRDRWVAMAMELKHT